MIRVYKFRLYPKEEQKSILNQFIGTSRFIYNHYLYKKEQLYKNENINYQISDMKKDLKVLQRWLSGCKSGSKNRIKVLLKLERVYEKLKNARKFSLHKLSKKLVEKMIL